MGRQVSQAPLAPALEVIEVSKRFGRTTALERVSLTVPAGEIHCLLGHNGSGKSTLAKVISGYHAADEGTVRFGGVEPHYPVSQATFRELGVGFVHQDIGLVGTGSVLENMLIGRFSTGAVGQIRWKQDRIRVRELLTSFELDVDLNAEVGMLSAAQRTMIGVLRAFQDIQGRVSGLLILDEVTAALPAEELTKVLNMIREIKTRGIAVLMVTHHLNEPLLLADHVWALRDGRLVASEAIDGQTESDLAAMVLGEQRRATVRRPTRPPAEEVVLEVRRARGHAAAEVAFTVRRGEVVGLTGLNGSGHDEVPDLLYGNVKGDVELVIDGKMERRPSPPRSLAHGMAMVSGDRATAGGVLPATLGENLTMPVLRTLTSSLRTISPRREKPLVRELISQFGIRPAEPSLVFSALSGGNQQKALLGRWMANPPKLMLLANPTSGIDIGAVDMLLEALERYVQDGGAIVVASSQYEDLTRLAHRVLIFRNGLIAEELDGDRVSPQEMLTRSYTQTPRRTTA